MTARTPLAPVPLVRNGAVTPPAGTAIAGLVAGGAYVAAPPGPNDVWLEVLNSGVAAAAVTVRAGGNGTSVSGGGNPGVPFDSAGQGDKVTLVPTGAIATKIGPFKSDRFTQADGSLSVDFAAGMTGTIWVIRSPVTGVPRTG